VVLGEDIGQNLTVHFRGNRVASQIQNRCGYVVNGGGRNGRVPHDAGPVGNEDAFRAAGPCPRPTRATTLCCVNDRLLPICTITQGVLQTFVMASNQQVDCLLQIGSTTGVFTTIYPPNDTVAGRGAVTFNSMSRSRSHRTVEKTPQSPGETCIRPEISQDAHRRFTLSIVGTACPRLSPKEPPLAPLGIIIAYIGSPTVTSS